MNARLDFVLPLGTSYRVLSLDLASASNFAEDLGMSTPSPSLLGDMLAMVGLGAPWPLSNCGLERTDSYD